MYLARVVGTVVSTCKNPHLLGQKLLVVQDLHDEGTTKTVIAVDGAGAGVGEIVLCLQEGGSARLAIRSDEAPVNDAIVGIVDQSRGYGPDLWS